MTTNITIVFGAALFVFTAASTATQPEGQTIWSGVFSAAQAKRGEAIADKRCATCHSADLAGGQDGPALVGAVERDERRRTLRSRQDDDAG
jgi:mono/diheme cytochrome c family protein